MSCLHAGVLGIGNATDVAANTTDAPPNCTPARQADGRWPEWVVSPQPITQVPPSMHVVGSTLC